VAHLILLLPTTGHRCAHAHTASEAARSCGPAVRPVGMGSPHIACAQPRFAAAVARARRSKTGCRGGARRALLLGLNPLPAADSPVAASWSRSCRGGRHSVT
jgi:hypothetical protein